MKENNLTDLMTRVQPGTRLRLTFLEAKGDKRRNAPSGRFRYSITDQMGVVLLYFIGLSQNGFVLGTMDKLTLMAVRESRYWDDQRNRVVEIQMRDGFDAHSFVRRLAIGLEKVEILT